MLTALLVVRSWVILPAIVTMFMVVNCLEPVEHKDINDKIKSIIGKYVNKIPDIKSRYVINDALSKVINHYFKGKISTLPLYKISLTIDRNPVKIPWTLDSVKEQQNESVIQRALSEQADKNVKQRQYKVLKSSLLGSAKLSGSKKAPDTSKGSPSPALTSSPPTLSTTSSTTEVQ